MLGNPSCQKQPTLITSAARKQAEALLSGGAWVPRSWFLARMRRCGSAAITALGDALGLAESDLGAFVCLPTTETPETAPDEELLLAGLSKTTAIIESVRAWRAERGFAAGEPRTCRTKAQTAPEAEQGQYQLAI